MGIALDRPVADNPAILNYRTIILIKLTGSK